MQHKDRFVIPLVVLAFMAVALLPTIQGGTADEPEMPDKAGDVDMLSLLGLKPAEAEHVQTNLSMFDITRAYVLAENPAGFWVRIDVHDLSGGIEPPDPSAPPLPTYGTFQTHFTIGDQKWFARAELEVDLYTDTDQDPPVGPLIGPNLTLHKDDLQETYVQQLTGLVSPLFDAVFFYIPKDAIGSPQTGEEMTGLFSVSLFDKAPLDYAPDPVFDPSTADPTDPLGSVALPEGADYRFGQYAGSGAPSVLELRPQGDTTLKAERGKALAIAFDVANTGDDEVTAQIGISKPYGWNVESDSAQLTVPAGATETVRLTATAGDKARSTAILKVTAGTTTETQSLVYALQLDDGAGDDPAQGNDPSRSPDQSLSASDDQDTPMVGLVPLVGGLVALAALVRRRAA